MSDWRDLENAVRQPEKDDIVAALFPLVIAGWGVIALAVAIRFF